jgi:hypothetical protein
MNPGDRVRIVQWATNNEGPYAAKDRAQLVGQLGTVVQSNDEYVSVRLDENPNHLPTSTVLAIHSELEVIRADENQANAS